MTSADRSAGPPPELIPELSPDLIVAGDHVLTMDPSRTILVDAAVLVAGGTIRGVVDGAMARARFPDVEVLGGPGHVVTPGFVNAHQHLTGDRLVRCSIPDDLPAGESIFSWAVPVHAHHSPDDDELSATLACVEAVTHGVTTTVEAGTVAHPDRVAAAMTAVGMRGSVGTVGLGRRGGSVRGAGGRGDRPAGRPSGPLPARRPRVGLGDARRPRPDVGRARHGGQRAGPGSRDPPHVPPLSLGLRSRRLPGAHGATPARPPRAARRAGPPRAGRARRARRRRRVRGPAAHRHRRRRLPVGVPAPRPGRHGGGPARGAGDAGRARRARVRQRERRRPRRIRCAPPPCSPDWPRTRAPTPPGSARTTRSTC